MSDNSEALLREALKAPAHLDGEQFIKWARSLREDLEDYRDAQALIGGHITSAGARRPERAVPLAAALTRPSSPASDADKMRAVLEAAPIIGPGEDADAFRKRQDAWLNGPYRAALDGRSTDA